MEIVCDIYYQKRNLVTVEPQINGTRNWHSSFFYKRRFIDNFQIHVTLPLIGF